MDYDFAALDFADDSEAARARRRGWVQAVQNGFHQGRVNDDFEKLWLDHVAADRVECRGVWLPEGAYGAGPEAVATTAWFDKTLNCGRELLPLRMITDVTTSPAHRRRGLVRRLMEDCLSDAVEHGLPLAALTVSEATIYGRWGFGAATFEQVVELDTGPRFGLRDFTDPGRVELVDAGESWPLLHEQLDRFHRTHRGSVAVPEGFEPFLTGAWTFRENGPDRHLRCAVHLSADGSVDGVVLYRQDGRDDAGRRKVTVSLLLAEVPDAALALWQFLAGIDLVQTVKLEGYAPDDPLRWALRDMNALRLTESTEFLWVRVLDVPRALAARPWSADGEVVLEVVDPLGHAAGRFLVTTREGVASVERTDGPAELTLDAETLGSTYLGAVAVQVLHAAGRVTGGPAAVARFAAMADLGDEPYNVIGF